MAKKTNEKKKVNIKLSNGQSYLVEDIDVFVHIQKTYAEMLRVSKSEEEKSLFLKIINSINETVSNAYIFRQDDDNEDW